MTEETFEKEELTEEEKSLISELKGDDLNDLNAHLEDLYSQAQTSKLYKIKDELDRCVMQRNQTYDAETLSKIKETTGGSKTYHSLTAEQCRSMQDLLTDFILRDNKLPFTIRPTPIPEISKENDLKISAGIGTKILKAFRSLGRIPDDAAIDALEDLLPQEKRLKIAQKAKEEAAIVQLKMQDKLVQSNIIPEFREFLADLSTFPNAFIMGPLFENKKRLSRVKEGDETKIVEVSEEVISFKRVSPYDVFPEPNIKDIQDGYVFIRSEVSPRYVENLRADSSYDASGLEDALEDYESNGGENTDSESMASDETRKENENKETFVSEPKKMWMTTFWGDVSGALLKSFGLSLDKDGEELDDLKQYSIWSVRIGKFVVKVEYNPYPLGVVPVHTTSAYREPGNFWHTGLPKIVRPYQTVINTAVRALQNNTAFSSAPIFELNISALPKGSEVTSIKPMMVIQSSSNTANMNNKAALTAIQTPMFVESLLYQIDKVSSYAGDASGISKYMSGGQVSSSGAVGRTASGMSMAMQAGSIKLKQIVANIDNDIIISITKMLYNLLLTRYNECKDLGDIQIVAGGTASVASKDQDSARMVELLRNISTPLMAPIVGKSGFRKILSKITESMGFGETQDIIPTDAEYVLQEKIEEMMDMQQQQQQTEQANKSQGNQPPNSKNLQPNGSEKGKQF